MIIVNIKNRLFENKKGNECVVYRILISDLKLIIWICFGQSIYIYIIVHLRSGRPETSKIRTLMSAHDSFTWSVKVVKPGPE